MSTENNCSPQGQQEPPQQEGEPWVELDNDQKTIKPLELLKTMQSMKYELQSIKENKLKDRQAQH